MYFTGWIETIKGRWLSDRSQARGHVTNAGFTLLELLATVVIVMILASVAMPFSKMAGKRTREVQLRQQLRAVRAAIDRFKLEWNRDGGILLGAWCIKNKLTCKEVSGVYGYPKSMETLLEVQLSGGEAEVRGTTTRRYLRKIPIDPMTDSTDWALRCYADPPDASSWCGDDVYDLATQSEGVALDGTNYRDW